MSGENRQDEALQAIAARVRVAAAMIAAGETDAALAALRQLSSALPAPTSRHLHAARMAAASKGVDHG